ncbi:hypothetical protein MITSMUL_05023 [Mitsuokella multacida DSM 20544]|uniref:Uncharacterized protein n=1 Tax=Mitsuokella multacida DSM 20544 TaxID=500635 RepID=C9KP68_9FIRM|nr:hypothetical protein MITSMUL_05023 [Mitsuokella multacida DSM 20544]
MLFSQALDRKNVWHKLRYKHFTLWSRALKMRISRSECTGGF